ncbi:MAG TPA: hypothetical protein VMB80_06835 [Candidatus Acidoferrum sp.]|nr:hypothetical protein [Candidatus Acidoferrum sp.]
MTRDEAKAVLLLYRPGRAEGDDPEIAAALALARQDPELARWLDEHCARQAALRSAFRQITAPAGLKEQIVSEQLARAKPAVFRHRLMFAGAALAVALAIAIPLWLARGGGADDYSTWRNRMASWALRGPYRMDLETNNQAAIRTFLAQKLAPADYALPAPLEQTAVTGCAIQDWHGVKVAMICYRTGKPLPPGQQSDLWLFVMDRAAVKNAPVAGARQFAQISRLGTMTWTAGDKLYVLGIEGGEDALRQYL